MPDSRARWFYFDSDFGDVESTRIESRWIVAKPLVTLACVVSAGWALTAVCLWTWYRRLLDFTVYMMGATHLADPNLYITRLSTGVHLPFTYPPFAAVFFWPFSILPFKFATMLWSIVNLVALLAILILTIRAVRPELDRRSLLTWSLLLLGPALMIEPVSLTFTFGQINLVLAVFVLADLTGRVEVCGKILPRGILLGIAAVIKLIPLIFVPYLLFTNRRREAITSLVTFASLSLLTFAINPTASWQYWTKYVVDAKRVGGIAYISNQSLRGSLSRFLHHTLSTGPVTVLSGLVVIGGLAIAWWAYKSDSPFLGILICASTGFLASPITWAHHMVWVIPVILWLFWGSDRPIGGRIWATLVALLFWWAPIWSVPPGSVEALHLHGWQLVRGNAFFLANVFFMISIAAMLGWRQYRRVTLDS